MKNTLNDCHKRYLRNLQVGFLTVLCLFIGGLAFFSISKLTAAPDTGKHISDKIV